MDQVRRDEITVAILAGVVSVGLMRADQLYQIFSSVDPFTLEGTTLIVHGPEFLAVICFLVAYLVFLALTFVGMYLIARRHMPDAGGVSNLEILAVVVIMLAVLNTFALFTASSHLTHHLNDLSARATRVDWDFYR